MKGIILAGGSGTRLYPITKGVSKQLLPVYDKPLIYYPLSTLMQAGIKDILVITTPDDQPGFKRLLGDGSDFGINISYTIQPSPDGLAQAFILGKDFIGDDECAMVLGDNIYFGDGFENYLNEAAMQAELGNATIFGCEVHDPKRFGIVEFDETGKVLSVEEKPENPKSNYAITGLYFYPKEVAEKAANVKPSKRGELEITSLNDMYLKEGVLKAQLLGNSFTWFDAGLFDSLNDASNLIRSVQHNKDKIIACPEAIAFEHGWLSVEQLDNSADVMKKNSYGAYLKKVSDNYKNNKKLTLENK
ncbi:MAG: glucose-1-phosphate thymidylyltransferase RfbA [Bacilli bacterium]|nr:glucose-1-phosphate thymidylyltransferase RfbA [Bacilli bacterium]